MKVLVACEESQAVTIAFRKLGITAFSCDIQDCSGGYPEWHIKDDIFNIINDGWDLMIGHPPCTYLSFAGNRWFDPKYGDDAIERLKQKDLAIDFFIKLFNADIKHICLENPMGWIHKVIPCSQIIQPYYFGDSDFKKTCLWLKNLPKLTYNLSDTLFWKKTSVEVKPYYYEKSGTALYFTSKFTHKDPIIRRKLRSKTFPGIADAMAKQWSEYIINKNQYK